MQLLTGGRASHAVSAASSAVLAGWRASVFCTVQCGHTALSSSHCRTRCVSPSDGLPHSTASRYRTSASCKFQVFRPCLRKAFLYNGWRSWKCV